jgi:bifunctional non-homologous end joining protein LigD
LTRRFQRKDQTAKEEKGFQMAVETALAAGQLLSEHNIKSFIKTSGKTGLHIYIPCVGIDFHESRSIANAIGDEIHKLVPSVSTRNESINQRGNRLYIDANQNDYTDTLAAPYPLRPYHRPLVSTPLEWKEVKPGLDRYDYNMESIHKRLEKKGDLFSGTLDVKTARSNQKNYRFFKLSVMERS